MLAVRIAMLVYSVLFAVGVYLDGTLPLLWLLLEFKAVVPVGTVVLLLLNVPLSVVTLVLRGKGRFDGNRSFAVLILLLSTVESKIAAKKTHKVEIRRKNRRISTLMAV